MILTGFPGVIVSRAQRSELRVKGFGAGVLHRHLCKVLGDGWKQIATVRDFRNLSALTKHLVGGWQHYCTHESLIANSSLWTTSSFGTGRFVDKQ